MEFSNAIHQIIDGRIVHDEPQQCPLHHFLVRLSTGNCLTGTVLTCRTDANGYFTFTLPVSTKTYNAFFEVISKPWESRNALFPWNREVVIARKTVSIQPEEHVSIGTTTVAYWEYMDGWARLKWPEQHTLQPQESTLEYDEYLAEATVRPFLTAELLLPTRTTPSLKRIQELFIKNFTSLREEKEPGSTQTPAFMVERFFEGFHSLNWRKAGKNTLTAVIDFDKYAFDNQNFLPNASVTITLHEQAQPTIDKIELEWKRMFPNEPKQVYTTENPDFSYALMAFRNASNVVQQNGEHLSKCHIYLEGYKVAAERNLILNPVGDLFRIFGEGVVSINKQGETIIFGKNGVIPITSALTADSAEQHIKDRLGSLDHLDWKPRKPLFPGDKEANISQCWWTVVNEFVEGYFTKHQQDITSPTGWFEVQQFSNDLVAHSQPWYPLEGVDKDTIWYDTNEIPYTRRHRTKYNGIRQAISPITTTATATEADVATLKNAVAHFIFLATLGHTFKHDIGADECGDPFYSSMSGGGVDEGLNGRVLPARDLSVRTLALLQTLKNFQYGYVTKNEDKTIPPEFLAIVEKYRDPLTSAGMNPDRIRSRVNI